MIKETNTSLLLYKGTKNRTKRVLELEIENMGGFLNAHTSREHTIFTTKVLKQNISETVEILSDIIQNSNYKAEDIEYEKGVILTEFDEVYKIPEELALDVLHEVVFPGSPFSFTILGPKANISRFTRKDIVNYVNSYYTCNRIGLVGVGAVDHDELVRLAEKNFATLRKSSPRDIDTYPKANFTPGYRNIKTDICADNFCTIAFEGPSWSSPDLIPILVAQAFAGNYSKYYGGSDTVSTFAERLVNSKLCETCDSFVTSYTTTGVVGFNITTKESNIKPLVEHAMAEFSRFTDLITEEDLERSKQKIKTSLVLSSESLWSACDDLARQLMTVPEVTPTHTFLEKIEQVDLRTLKDIFYNYYIEKKPGVISLGENVEELDFNSLQPKLYQAY